MRVREVTGALATATAMGLSAVLPSTVLAQPAALDQAPAGADMVIFIPSLRGLSDEIAEFRQTLNLPVFELDDALSAFKASTGMNAGLNDAGSFLLVLPDLGEALQAEREPETLMLVPVSDYDAFVQSFGGEAGGAEGAGGAGGIAAVTMPDGQPAFARQLGDYAVMGKTRQAVEGYEAGNAGAAIAEKVGALGQRYLDQADLLVYLDVEEVRPALQPALQQSIAQMTQMFEMGMPGVDPAQAANAKAVWQMYGAAAETVIRDARGFLAAVDLEAGGIGVTYAVSYNDGSTLAEVFPGAQGAPQALLASLPTRPFIFAGAFDAQAIDLKRLTRRMLEAFPEGDPMRQLSEKAQPLVERLEGASMAFYAPQMAMMGNIMNTVSVLQVDDAPGYVQALKTYVQEMNGVEIAASVPADPADPNAVAPTISYTTTYTDNAMQLQGQQVDQFQMTTNFPPELLQQMGPAAGFAQNMFGTYSGYVTGKDSTVVMTTILDPQLVSGALEQVGERGGLGAAGAMARLRDAALPPEPVFQAYLGFDGIAQTANTFLQMFGAQPLNIPADLPPIASGLSIEDNSLAYRIYFPTETIKFVVDSGMSLQQQFGGMGGPGGPGAPNRGPGGPPPF